MYSMEVWGEQAQTFVSVVEIACAHTHRKRKKIFDPNDPKL